MRASILPVIRLILSCPTAQPRTRTGDVAQDATQLGERVPQLGKPSDINAQLGFANLLKDLPLIAISQLDDYAPSCVEFIWAHCFKHNYLLMVGFGCSMAAR